MPDIRFAAVADIPIIQALTNQIWPATYRGILATEQISYMLELIYSTTALHRQMTDEAHEFIILSIDDIPVAFASYGRQDKINWKLHKLYVLPALHSKGIGKALIDFIITEVKNNYGKNLLLNVNRYNPARSFYERLGFKIIAEEDIDIGAGYFMNDYIMSLAL